MAQQAGAPLKLFVARKIITMDPGWPTATAVAVRDGRIVSVGSLADLQPWLDRYPHDVAQTFADKVLLPGFIDPHQHPLVGGAALCLPTVAYYDTANPYGPPARGLKTKAEVIGRLRELAGQSQASDEPLLAWGYDAIALGGPLTKDDLDAVSTTRQVIVWDASEHDMFANSAALRARNVTRESTRLAGVCTGPDGEPNGHFAGKPASLTYFADVFQSTLQPDRIAKIMQYIVDLNRQGGVTTMADLALGIAAGVDVEAALFARFFNDPRTPVRCLAVVDAGAMTRQHGDQAVAAALALRSQNTDKFCFNGVKFFSDDAFVSLGMQVAAPGYTDGHGGLWITDASAATEEQMRPWWKAGFDIHVHTNGDASQSALLDTLAALQRDYPRFDHRFTFEHYGLSTPAQARRLKALGAAVSANGYYLWLRGEINAAYLGTDRSYLASRLRTLVDAGVPTAMHSDTPIAPPRPLLAAWIAVNRYGQSGRVLAPAERVTLDQALRMITIDAAYVLRLEDQVGSIEAGKLADFTVLEQDPYEVPPEELRDIPVWGTVFGGEVFPTSQITGS